MNYTRIAVYDFLSRAHKGKIDPDFANEVIYKLCEDWKEMEAELHRWQEVHADLVRDYEEIQEENNKYAYVIDQMPVDFDDLLEGYDEENSANR
jgi:hypothetical protein